MKGNAKGFLSVASCEATSFRVQNGQGVEGSFLPPPGSASHRIPSRPTKPRPITDSCAVRLSGPGRESRLLAATWLPVKVGFCSPHVHCQRPPGQLSCHVTRTNAERRSTPSRFSDVVFVVKKTDTQRSNQCLCRFCTPLHVRPASSSSLLLRM